MEAEPFLGHDREAGQSPGRRGCGFLHIRRQESDCGASANLNGWGARLDRRSPQLLRRRRPTAFTWFSTLWQEGQLARLLRRVEATLESTKGGKPRYIYPPLPLIDRTHAYVREERGVALRRARNRDEERSLFLTDGGSPLTPRRIGAIFAEACKRAVWPAPSMLCVIRSPAQCWRSCSGRRNAFRSLTRC